MGAIHSAAWRVAAFVLFFACVRVASAIPATQIEWLDPATDAASVESIIDGSRDADFRPAAQGLLRAPSDRVAWYRVRLSDDWNADSSPLLIVSGDVRAKLVLYLPPAYAPHAASPYAADLDPRWSRHSMVFQLPRDLHAGQSIYLALGAPGQTQPIRVRVVEQDRYQIEDLHHLRLSVFFASVQAAMLMVILCFWLVLRDRVFAYFIGYVSAQLVYQLAATGELYALPGAAWLAPLGFHPGQFAAIVSAGLSISFIIEFADLARYVPRLARVLAALRWPYLLLAIALWLPPLQPDSWLPNAVNGLLVLSTVLALYAAWRAWRRGSRQAGFFLISWLPLLSLTVLRVAQLLFGLALPRWLEYGFPASMAYAAVVIAVGLADRTLQARRERDIAHRLAELDPLTRVLNRRAILARLHTACAAARQARAPLAALFLDLDHFKRINDNHGHAAGDSVLAVVATAMQDELRERDWLGRYGGEEFLIVLPDANELLARNIAERIRARIAATPIPHGEVELHLTVSIGIGLLDEATATVEALVEHADIALYRAKAQGRNRVMQYLPGEKVEIAALPRQA
jgi:diguanylate cyclase (GGDEF)-like protein